MKRFGLAAAALMLILALAPAVDATTTWTARPAGHGTASLRVGSPSRLVLALTGFRAGSIWTVSLRRGTCSSLGTLVVSLRVTAGSTGRLARTVTLTAAQTRLAARLPLALRFGSSCARLAAPVVVAPTPTPTPTPTAEPGTFRDGIWRVGATIEPGTYRAVGAPSCYWARLSGFGGTLDEIIANELGSGPQVATIASTDTGFKSSGCGMWRLSAPAVPTAAPGDGTWRVGLDIAPGTYQATVTTGFCYWVRLAAFSGSLDDILANVIVMNGPALVTIEATDAGFKSSGCGTWMLAP
jgi:hypothetical protein